jgi:hypothetical protein
MNTIILIHGKAGTGKDTVCDMLSKNLIKDTLILRVGNADGVKLVSRKSFNWDFEKDERGRQLLIDVTNAGYNYDEYFWEKVSEKTIKGFLDIPNNEDKLVIVPDWRYPCTYKYWTELSELPMTHIITVNVISNSVFNYSDKITKEKSEAGLDDFNFDFIIVNKGTLEDLQLEVKEFIKEAGL